MLSRRQLLKSAAATIKAPPSLILITADNLGYGDLGCYGNREISTPNLDRFAAQGIRFTNFYTASPTCTASRAGLLTGRHPIRCGLNYQLSAEENKRGIGLPHRERIFPRYLKGPAYTTACFGKWNLGFAPGSRPTDRGFDEFFGHRSGNIDYYSHLYNGDLDLYRGTEPARMDGYAPDLFADEACKFLKRRLMPFFLYLPLNTPHYPNPRNLRPGEKLEWQVPAKYLERYGYPANEPDPKRRYRAVITAMDDAVGRVLRTLDEVWGGGVPVVFLSDNGAFMAPGHGLEVASNKPLRDGGVTCWEGGIRVCAMARGIGGKPGTVCNEMLSSLDILPLMLRMANLGVPAGVVLDGKDPTAAIAGGKSPHEALYFEYQKHQAMRWKNWKLVRPDKDGAWQLYDLTRDEGETRDLAAANAPVAQEMARRFDVWRASVAASVTGRSFE